MLNLKMGLSVCCLEACTLPLATPGSLWTGAWALHPVCTPACTEAVWRGVSALPGRLCRHCCRVLMETGPTQRGC